MAPDKEHSLWNMFHSGNDPVTFFCDAGGTIRQRMSGYNSATPLRLTLENLLKPKETE